MTPRRALACAVTAVLLVAGGVTAAVARPGEPSGPVVLRVWRHSGTPQEHRTFAAQVRRFNRGDHGVRVVVRTIAEGDYNDHVQAAAASASLPDVLDLDGPTVAGYAYQEDLAPLDDLLPAAALRAQLPSLRAQARWHGRTWAVATFDSGLGLYGDRVQLRAAGVRLPAGPSDAWTAAELDGVLSRLAGRDPDGKVLDVKRNYGLGEWLTYGFAPLVASAGGELLDPATGTATGHLDGEPAQRALADVRRWSAYVDDDADDKAFVDRRVALSWVGHWAYPDYAAALGDDLVVLPLPDLGAGTKTGQGSWAWAVSRSSAHRTAAATFLDFLLRDREVRRMAEANGGVPGTRTALARSALYGAGGPLRLFAEQLLDSCGDSAPSAGCVAVPRPRTPGYPMLTAEFAAAVSAALAGDDPLPLLHAAARAVDADRAANHGWR